jgi:hypothetical protein
VDETVRNDIAAYRQVLAAAGVRLK